MHYMIVYAHRYEFKVAIPPNHDKRLDIQAKALSTPQLAAPSSPAEGVLGHTLGHMYGVEPAPEEDQQDVVDIWDPEELDHIRHSQKLEDWLRKNYRVTDLFVNDAARTQFDSSMNDGPSKVGYLLTG